MKLRIIAGLLLVHSLLVAGSPTFAQAGPNSRSATVIEVRGSLHAEPSSLPDAQCPAGTQYSMYPEYSGVFSGTGVVCGRSNGVNSDGSLSFAETNKFTGTVSGCGAGSITYSVEGVVYPLDPVTQTLPANEDWQIIEGSGTGGLRRLRSGGGHNNAVINSDGSIDAEFNGFVRCTPPRT